MAPTKTHSFNVMLSVDEYAMLEDLKAATGIAGSVLLRQALRGAHQMAMNLVPTCANGHQCLCPAGWTNVTSTTHANTFAANALAPPAAPSVGPRPLHQPPAPGGA